MTRRSRRHDSEVRSRRCRPLPAPTDKQHASESRDSLCKKSKHLGTARSPPDTHISAHLSGSSRDPLCRRAPRRSALWVASGSGSEEDAFAHGGEGSALFERLRGAARARMADIAVIYT